MTGAFPEVAFTLGPVAVRSTVVGTWMTMLILVVLGVVVGRRRPAALDLVVVFILDAITSVMGRPGHAYLPLLGSLAVFIAGSSIIGVIPLIDSPTKDVNTPLALALVVFFSVHAFGIRRKGVRQYFKDMADPLIVLPLELLNQVTRTLSLTLRLFGNVVSIELAVAIVFALTPLFVPLPLVAFSLVTGLVQAYVFAALAAVYIAAGLEVTDTPIRNFASTKESLQA